MEIVLRIQANASQTCQTYEGLKEYGLDSIDCPICENHGYIVYMKEGIQYSKECKCMEQRRYIRRIKLSGMADMMGRYTMKAYQTPDAARREIKAKAMQFCKEKTGWWYISGRAGSGKTHICVAICNEFATAGKNVRYMLWRDESVELKGMVNEPEYKERMDKLKTVPVLYIDDFFKAGNKKITDADISLAFELINARYNDSKLRTIISSEISAKELLGIDEATGSRIWERAVKVRAPQENWRLR